MSLTSGHLWIPALPCDHHHWGATHHEALCEVWQTRLPNQGGSASQMVVSMNLFSSLPYFVIATESRLLWFITLAQGFTWDIKILILIGVAPKQWFQNTDTDFFPHFCVWWSPAVSQAAWVIPDLLFSGGFTCWSRSSSASYHHGVGEGVVKVLFLWRKSSEAGHSVLSPLARTHSHQSRLRDTLGICSFILGDDGLMKVRLWLIKSTGSEEN